VDLFDLLKESFRQRPDYIIVGEVRGQEAYILFQQMATGHPSLATIHAEDMPKLMDRLTTPPISLPPTLIGSLDLLVFMARMKYRDKFVRRITEVVEMVEYDAERNEPIVNRVMKWNSDSDRFETSKSVVLKKIVARTGMKEKEIADELERRMVVLNWMKENNVLNYQDVNKVINMYYNYPQRTISMIMERV
jgi:flagellar protein FlaI